MADHRYDAAIEALEVRAEAILAESRRLQKADVPLTADLLSNEAHHVRSCARHLRSLRDKPEERPQQPAAFPPEVVERTAQQMCFEEVGYAWAVLDEDQREHWRKRVRFVSVVIAEHLQSAEVRERVANVLHDFDFDDYPCCEHVADAVLAAVVGKGGG